MEDQAIQGAKKVQYEVLKQLLEMKDSDDEYEKWMKELEIERDKRVKKVFGENGVAKELEIWDQDLINKCLFVSLVGLGKLHNENLPNYMKAVNYYSQDFDVTCSIC